ncbi:MAG: hypothetical protein JO083_07315 [Candidatus Eremiobacteraeota bacterium]|nr:hypothetical protein [Candidatus Eremiobacteraeota bacterium]
MTPVAAQACTATTTLKVEERAVHAAFTSTLYGAAGTACSPTLETLGRSAGKAYAAVLCEPESRAAWTMFVQSVFAFLDELDAGVGIALDHAAARSRHELRDIIYENADLLASDQALTNAR